jgi:RNA polymerase sigma-70 factor (ECF subfamily)
MAGAALSARELVERAQQGDVDAFGELYDRYTQVVFRFVLSRVGNYALAEDLTGDTFVRAWRRLETFTWKGRDVGGWLITIARNLVADHFASARYRREVATEDVLTSAPTELVDGPEDIVVRNAERVRVLSALSHLGHEQRACVEARFLKGLSVAETAQLLGRNDGAVRALQYRALRSLANILPRQTAA